MTDAWRSIRLTEFEHVVTGPTQSLLRVCGQAPMEHARGPRPVLVIEAGDREARFHPLRAPEDLRGVIRAAYAVPTSLVTGSACWLETSSGARVELPAPVQGAGRRRDDELLSDQLLPGPPLPEAPPPVSAKPDIPPDAVRAEVRPAPVAGDPAEALRDAQAQIRSLAQKVTELERARGDDRHVAADVTAQAETRASSAEEREAAAPARAESAERATSTLNELQVWRAELERRLAETTTELGALRARREADERELVRLRVAVEKLRSEGGAGGNRADSEGGDGEIVAIQAEEIQRLAAELAALRSRAARGG